MLDNGLLGQFRGKLLCALSSLSSGGGEGEDRGLSRVLGARLRPSAPCSFAPICSAAGLSAAEFLFHPKFLAPPLKVRLSMALR